MKSLRIDPRWMPELLDMARQDGIKRLEPVVILFSTIQLSLNLRNPIAIFTFEIEWVSQMAEAMLRPAVFMIVYTLLEQGWVAVFIFQEQGVTLRRNCEAIDPPRCFLVDGS
jgi:hypothetical protein